MGEWIRIVVPRKSPILVSIIHFPIPYEEPDSLSQELSAGLVVARLAWTVKRCVDLIVEGQIF